MTPTPQRAIAVAAATAIALGLAGCAAVPPAAQPSPSVTATPAPTPEVQVPVAPATPPPAPVVVPPTTVSVPAVDVEVPVIPVGVDANDAMELPVDPAVAGWYRFGADPSTGRGHTVVSAHVDAPEYPIGPFSRLRDLAPGTEIQVADAAGVVHRYAVVSVTDYRKTELPVAELFSREGDPRLVLITCGGPFDASIGRYEDNVVVQAVPIA